MTWLSDVEKFSTELRRTNELEHHVRHPETDREQMARVIRELVEHTEDAKAWAEHAGIYLVDGMAGDDPVLARLCKEAFKSWNNLSPDAKEIMESEK